MSTAVMLDCCAEHGITADVEVLPVQKVNEAHERGGGPELAYRFERFGG